MPSPSALIVEPVLSDALFLVEIASSLGFHVTVAATFHEAAERLRVPPVLLVADIRLNEYNGLHLVLEGKSARPDLAAIVTSVFADPVLRSEAEQLGATFVVKPISTEELRAAISRTVLRKADLSAGPIRPPFERRKVETRGTAGAVFQPDGRVTDRRGDVALLIQQAASG